MEATQQAEVITPATPPVVEAPKQEAQPEKKEGLSSQFAALARKEKKIQSERQALEARNKELEEKIKKYEAFEEKKKNAKTNPFDYLSEAGLTYDELTEAVLNGGKPQPKDKATELEEKFNTLQAKIEQEKQEKAEAEQKRLEEENEKVIKAFKDSVNKQLADKRDSYELINLYDAQELVISTIEAHFEKTKEILDVDAAADLVEKHLESEVKKLANSNKFKDKFKLEEPAQQQQEKKSTVTLSSEMPSSSVPSSLPAKTEEERLKRALAALG